MSTPVFGQIPPPAPPPAPRTPTWQLVLAGGVAYALFWFIGRPLLPATVAADPTAGLLPTLVVVAASASLLRGAPHATVWVLGLTLAVLAVFSGLMHLLH